MKDIEDLVFNWLFVILDFNVVVGIVCKFFKVEMVICGYLSGYVVCEYKVGRWMICGVFMFEGMIENDKFL